MPNTVLAPRDTVVGVMDQPHLHSRNSGENEDGVGENMHEELCLNDYNAKNVNFCKNGKDNRYGD